MNQTVTILDGKNKIKTLSVEYKPSAIIANEFESARELGKIVAQLGYEVGYTTNPWPRDYMVSFNEHYISRGEGGRKIAEGGCFVFGKDYLIFSEEIYFSNEADRLKRKLQKTLEQFFKVPAYSVGSYCSRGGSERHIDLTLLTIPQRNMLIVDENHYKQIPKDFKHIAKAQNLELVIAKNCQLWALNCLVLDYQGSPVVIANEKTRPFLKLLKELKLNYATVLADQSPELGGSVRCRTNTAANLTLFDQFGFHYRKK